MKRLRVLIGCEFTGITRQAFTDAGHLAMSCDFLPTEIPGPHYQGDLRDILKMVRMGQIHFDLAIFHPDCTYFTNAGARWFTDPRPKYATRAKKREAAILFFRELQDAKIPRICIENPQPGGYVMGKVGRYSQKIQPYMFGTPESKGLCLWLRNLPPLEPTVIIPKKDRKQSCWKMGPKKNKQGEDVRGRERSRSFPLIAGQMAAQWGNL